MQIKRADLTCRLHGDVGLKTLETALLLNTYNCIAGELCLLHCIERQPHLLFPFSSLCSPGSLCCLVYIVVFLVRLLCRAVFAGKTFLLCACLTSSDLCVPSRTNSETWAFIKAAVCSDSINAHPNLSWASHSDYRRIQGDQNSALQVAYLHQVSGSEKKQ